MTVYGGEAISGPSGFTYTGIFTRGARGAVLEALGALRFSGWVGPQEGEWVVAVPTRAHGVVAGDKARADDVARALASAVGSASLAVTVDDDRLLRMWSFSGDADLGDYLSDPSVAFPNDDEAGPDPIGADNAAGIAAACGRPEAADDLEDLLGEELGESTNESERLTAMCRLLGLPDWLVAAASLPNVPGGPKAAEVTKLGAGKEGVAGAVDAAIRGLVRKKK